MYHVILVHGTFAKDAEWIQSGSRFENLMREQLGDVQATFQKFDWTGQNSHKARFDAADNLAHELKKAFVRHPDKKHVVVAHSHGGNVVLYALKSIGQHVPKDIRFVALSTPFINCERNDLDMAQGIIIGSFVIVACVLYAKFIFPIGEFVSAQMEDPWWVSLLLLIGIYLTGKTVLNYSGKYFDTLRHKSSELMERLTHKDLPLINTLIISVKGDEALGWLYTAIKPAQFTGFAFKIVWLGALLGFIAFFGIIFIQSVGFALLAQSSKSFGFEVPFDINSAYKETDSFLFDNNYILIPIYALLIAVAIAFILIPIGYLFRSNKLVFGAESLGNIFSLTIFPTREFPISLKQNSTIYERDIREAKGLLHSEAYGNAKIVEDIANWIKLDSAESVDPRPVIVVGKETSTKKRSKPKAFHALGGVDRDHGTIATDDNKAPKPKMSAVLDSVNKNILEKLSVRIKNYYMKRPVAFIKDDTIHSKEISIYRMEKYELSIVTVNGLLDKSVALLKSLNILPQLPDALYFVLQQSNEIGDRVLVKQEIAVLQNEKKYCSLLSSTPGFVAMTPPFEQHFVNGSSPLFLLANSREDALCFHTFTIIEEQVGRISSRYDQKNHKAHYTANFDLNTLHKSIDAFLKKQKTIFAYNESEQVLFLDIAQKGFGESDFRYYFFATTQRIRLINRETHGLESEIKISNQAFLTIIGGSIFVRVFDNFIDRILGNSSQSLFVKLSSESATLFSLIWRRFKV